jgi:uncharacterized peroxidase-related enzyme
MAYIDVDKQVPGIRSLVLFRPETGKPLYELAQVLLRGASPLSPAERELIAAYVSHRNECGFCRDSHAAAARCLYGDERSVVDEWIFQQDVTHLSVKMQVLLELAGKVQTGGQTVKPEDIARVKALGVHDEEIHDTVLIAATFSLFNRYVDGLNSLTPTDPKEYAAMGERLSRYGYVPPAVTSV